MPKPGQQQAARLRAKAQLKRKNRKERRLKIAEEAARKEGKTGAAVKTAANDLVENKTRPGTGEQSIASSFAAILQELREQTSERVDENGKVIPAHNAAIDIKLQFRSLDLQKKGLIFRKEQKENSVSLELATRILPDES